MPAHTPFVTLYVKFESLQNNDKVEDSFYVNRRSTGNGRMKGPFIFFLSYSHITSYMNYE